MMIEHGRSPSHFPATQREKGIMESCLPNDRSPARKLHALVLMLAAAATPAWAGSRAAAQEGDDCATHDRNRQECSPGTEAPTPEALAQVIRSGVPAALESALEYGERVECAECMPLLEANLLDAADPDVRRMSAWWLRRRGLTVGAVVRRMRQALDGDPDPVRRARAALALGELMASRAVPTLADAAAADVEAPVRAAAVRALGRMNHPDAGPVVSAALEDADPAVRLAAADQVLVLSFFQGDDALLALLADVDPVLRRRGARLLADRGVMEAVPPLVALLEADPEPSVRQAAAWALGRLGTPEARSALDARSQVESHPRVRDALRVARLMPAGL